MFFRLLLALIFSLSVLQLSAHREQTYYLQGAMDGQTVYLKLEEFGDACFAKYFNETDLYDHVLEGAISADTAYVFNIYNPDTSQTEIIGTIQLKEIQTNIWQGTLKRQSHPEQKLSFSPLSSGGSVGTQGASDSYDLSPYATKRLSFVTIEQGRTQAFSKEIKLIPIFDPVSGIEIFQIKHIKGCKTNLDSINSSLQLLLQREIDFYYGCASIDGRGAYSASFALHYLNENMVSFSHYVKTSCYGGDLNMRTTHFCLSVRNTAPIQLKDLVWFSHQAPGNLSEGEYNWYQYRYNIFAPQVFSLLQEQYGEKLASENGCPVNAVEHWQFPTWYVGSEGIYVQASDIYTKDCINSWFLLPYKALSPFLKGSYGLPYTK